MQLPHQLFVLGGLLVLFKLLLERITALAMCALKLLFNRLLDNLRLNGSGLVFGFLEAVRCLIEKVMTLIEILRL